MDTEYGFLSSLVSKTRSFSSLPTMNAFNWVLGRPMSDSLDQRDFHDLVLEIGMGFPDSPRFGSLCMVMPFINLSFCVDLIRI